ncbi:MAG: hypothetical protein HZB79_09715 [Deltaproteobacteria bacterium]|nr:hypothetical protein [Deltaproteobacteria bacterium]
MRQTILIFFLLITTNLCYSKDSTVSVNNDRQTLEKFENDIKEIRRDQLNYKIEKDLLKETYSSNYTTVQIVITIALGFFAIISTILGYVGFKSIFKLKGEYDSELTKIKELKSDFEIKLKELTKSQEKVQSQITSIDTLNEEQDKKIKLLEIKEKIGYYYRQKGYQRALDYIAIGLEMAKDDIELLMFRAFFLVQLRNYVEAIETYKKILTIEPMNQGAIRNLAELYLVAGQTGNYNNIVKDKLEFFKATPLLTYLEAFKFYLENKFTDLKNKISEFIEKQDVSINKDHLGNWDLTEFYDTLKNKYDSPEKALLINFANYLKGGMSGSQIKTLLSQ